MQSNENPHVTPSLVMHDIPFVAISGVDSVGQQFSSQTSTETSRVAINFHILMMDVPCIFLQHLADDSMNINGSVTSVEIGNNFAYLNDFHWSNPSPSSYLNPLITQSITLQSLYLYHIQFHHLQHSQSDDFIKVWSAYTVVHNMSIVHCNLTSAFSVVWLSEWKSSVPVRCHLSNLSVQYSTYTQELVQIGIEPMTVIVVNNTTWQHNIRSISTQTSQNYDGQAIIDINQSIGDHMTIVFTNNMFYNNTLFIPAGINYQLPMSLLHLSTNRFMVKIPEQLFGMVVTFDHNQIGCNRYQLLNELRQMLPINMTLRNEWHGGQYKAINYLNTGSNEWLDDACRPTTSDHPCNPQQVSYGGLIQCQQVRQYTLIDRMLCRLS
jgi:hypothetical protein